MISLHWGIAIFLFTVSLFLIRIQSKASQPDIKKWTQYSDWIVASFGFIGTVAAIPGTRTM
jgi:hypothetical protein